MVLSKLSCMWTRKPASFNHSRLGKRERVRLGLVDRGFYIACNYGIDVVPPCARVQPPRDFV